MKLQNRIELLIKLGNYLLETNDELQTTKARAFVENGWFIPEFVDAALHNIATQFLEKEKLEKWVNHYRIDDNIGGKNVGIVMAGNIPLVGFHDFLCVFISGHKQTIKLSSKDSVLLKHIAQKMTDWNADFAHHVAFEDMLKGCDAYIATGSNNTGRYFEQYFGKYPNIIRKNRTSVAVLTGEETTAELEKLADDVHLYFGLGCRNVTKIYVPEGYDFVPILRAFDSYKFFADHNKYKNNYDYQLSLALLNNIFYMTNEATLLIENEQIFSPISQLNYSFYNNNSLLNVLNNNADVQCIVGKNFVPFGMAQQPGLMEYADGVDTMEFLLGI
ncbi:MAG: acyl-CoA reductase [Ferruginibacter sp.]|nr:acyl-CoA reductase [Ferruginibacter sp.]